jgi:ergothioneine biosynthesis protein EgtB
VNAGLSDAALLEARFRSVRAQTEALCKPLQPEDYVVQSMPDASPAKWHLAHTSWFFETFVLEAAVPGYEPFHPQYRVLFNSYYEAVGPRHTRAERGLLTRPGVAEVMAYRAHVDDAVGRLLRDPCGAWRRLSDRIELGLQHEQQHQELLLTDLQHAFSKNPLWPVYAPRADAAPERSVEPLRFDAFEGGVESIGFEGPGFAFDNERPRHREWVEPFQLAERLISSAEYIEFIRDGGYQRPELWLSDGWATVKSEAWQAPLYWEERDGQWCRYSLHGETPIRGDDPVCHISFYEADAYAHWAKARLPTEAEWEVAYAGGSIAGGQFLEEGALLPRQTRSGFGSAWVWTATPYVAYPGFKPEAGAIGEYNGKFMCNQMVLRGGSCFTPQKHIRASYRNFFPPSARWQVTGIRLAR